MSRAKALTGHPLAIVSTAADLDAELLRLAATSTVYQPAGPQSDDPAEWAVRPQRFARFRCVCGARFHVRRHLEAHQCGADQGPDSRVVDRRHYTALRIAS